MMHLSPRSTGGNGPDTPAPAPATPDPVAIVTKNLADLKRQYPDKADRERAVAGLNSSSVPDGLTAIAALLDPDSAKVRGAASLFLLGANQGVRKVTDPMVVKLIENKKTPNRELGTGTDGSN